MTETLERELMRDLESLGERFADEKFCTALYRALSRNTWSKQGGPDGHVALSFSRAEELVNELRGRHGQPQLTLAQTGDEGEVEGTVGDELHRLGWTHHPLNTSRHDAQHVGSPGQPRPTPGGQDWEQQAHEEAEATRERTVPVRDSGDAGSAGGAT